MLRRATFSYFRSLLDVSLDFAPLTVLVGGNATGKSSILHALALPNLSQRDVWRHGNAANATLVIEGTSDTTGEAFRHVRQFNAAAGQRNAHANGPTPQALALRLEPDTLKGASAANETRRIGTRGEGLAALFATLDRDVKGEVSRTFCSLVPMFADVNDRPGSNSLRLVFTDRWNPKTVYETTEVSDGTLLVLAYLLVQYQVPQVDLLLIEEPERGLHPYLLGKVVEILRGMAMGTIGPRVVQTVMATHSPQLLDYLQPEEVRFLSRKEDDGSVVIRTLSSKTEAWKSAFEVYDQSLGGIWLSGGAGGVPGV